MNSATLFDAKPPVDDLPPTTNDNGQPPRRRRRLWLRVLVALVVLALVVPAALFAIAYAGSDIPRPADMAVNQVATIVADDGKTVVAKIVPPEGNRVEVKLSDVPKQVQAAMLSAEDRDFYTNSGFSISGILRAARDNALDKESAGGGSTITQQYVKNAFVGSQRTITRKLKELVLATKMTREWSKDDILAAYLNTIFFGRGAYGVSAASQAYFGKPVGKLTVEEGAVLASVIRSPSALDPETHLNELKLRWNYVMDGLVSMKSITQADRDNAGFPKIIPLSQMAGGEAPGPEGHIRTQVLHELAEAGITQKQIDTLGLKITTTIDPKVQQAAEDAAKQSMKGEDEELRTAVVSIDPRTGAVKGYYGGDDGAGLDFAQAPLQTGSSFKTFGLAAALKDGIPLSARYDSSELTVHGIRISNVDGESCGRCTIAEAFKRSLNTAFYRLALSMENGPQKIADMAHAAGIPEHIPGVPGKSLSENGGEPETGIILGQYQSRPIDMASAYATFAASGVFHKPFFVSKVVTNDGEVLLNNGGDAGKQTVPKAVAENLTQAMLPIPAWSRNHNLWGGRPAAAKTGTTQYLDTGDDKDAWMVGYTPSLSTAVWVGKADGQPIYNSWGGPIYGSGLPSDIWQLTMEDSLEGTDVESFPWPDPIGGQAGVPSNSYVGTSGGSGGRGTGGGGGGGGTAKKPDAPAAPAEKKQVEIFPGFFVPVG
ncbi:MAG: penicillin-binding protein [Nocardiaceae bacterium]|nr:penicillin-binding protein [Nocardiaceae bacterium]